MKQLIRWFKALLSRPDVTTAAEQPTKPLPEKSDDLMPDIYSESDADTVPQIKTLDEPSPDDDKSAGFNPYDTAVLHKKQ